MNIILYIFKIRIQFHSKQNNSREKTLKRIRVFFVDYGQVTPFSKLLYKSRESRLESIDFNELRMKVFF